MVTPVPPVRAPHTPTHGAHGQRLVMINIGPQHPATHGVLRLKVMLEGEIIRDVEPVLGYLHRGVEKLFEDGSYLQAIPMTDRLDYLAAMHNNYALCHSVETLMGVSAQIPERAQYIRALTTEVQRIASHLLWLGAFALDMGAMTVSWSASRAPASRTTGSASAALRTTCPPAGSRSAAATSATCGRASRSSTTSSWTTTSSSSAPWASAPSPRRWRRTTGAAAPWRAAAASTGTCAATSRSTPSTRRSSGTSSRARRATPTRASCAASAR